MLGSGVAAAAGAMLLGAAILLAGADDDSSDSRVNPSDTGSLGGAQFAANFEKFKSKLNHVKLRALQGRVAPEDLESLRDATSQLADSGQPPDAESRQEVEQALNEQYALVFDLADELPDEQVSRLQDVLVTTQKAADDLGITNFPSLPTPTDGVTETPKEPPTPTDTPTPPVETAAPTEAPSPTPTAPAQTEG